MIPAADPDSSGSQPWPAPKPGLAERLEGGAASSPAMEAILSSRLASAAMVADGAVPSQPEAALESLLRSEETTIRGVIAQYVRNASLVDDLFQESAMKCVRRLASVRDMATLRGWVYQLVRNTCVDHLRRVTAAPRVSSTDLMHGIRANGDDGRNPAEEILTKERIAAIHRAVADLPKSQRDVIGLRIEQGMDHEAIAAHLGVSRQVVEVRLCKGRAALKARLDEVMVGEL